MKLLFRGLVTRLAGLGFVPLALLCQPNFAADVKTALVEKEIQYVQTSASTPLPDLNNGAVFEADVKSFGTNTVSSVTITVPPGIPDTLPAAGSDEFKLKKKYNKQSSLDASFPDGSYSLRIDSTHDGLKTFVLALTGDLYPNTPRVSNFAAVQSLDAGTYALCAWDPFSTGGPDDFIQLHLDDSQGNKVWETPDLGEPGALDGTAVSTLIPARALGAGQTFQASLLFAKASARDSASYPGAIGAALYVKRTKFAIQTIATETHADVKLYGVSKSARFDQKDAGLPTVQTNKPFNIDVFVQASSASSVGTASVVLPGGAPQSLSVQPDGKTFEYSDDALLQSGLDATYPNGKFTFQISTSSGLKTPALDLTGNAYPAAPHLQTLPTLADSAADITVRWDRFVGGSTDDFAQLHVEDENANKVFETPDFGKSGALNGTATEATIPAGSLSPGKTYSARVVLQKNVILDTTSYPGALGVANYAARTTFKLTTASTGPGPAPHLTIGSASAATPFRLTIEAPAGAAVTLQASSDLRQWSSVSSNSVPSNGQLSMTDSLTAGHPLRFYRALLSP